VREDGLLEAVMDDDEAHGTFNTVLSLADPEADARACEMTVVASS
jgi:hypothetical protein